MKLKFLAIGLMMLFSLNIFGQQQKATPITVQSHKTEVQALEETVSQLQADNQELQRQLEKLGAEVELYRGDVRNKVAELDEAQSRWLTMLAIIMGLIGVVFGMGVPIYINRGNSNRLENRFTEMKGDLMAQVGNATEQAKDAKEQAELVKQKLTDIEKIEEQVTAIKEKIDENARAAEKSAKEAQANRLFNQAVSEKDDFKAIELYNRAIDFKPDFSEAYNNRGILKANIGDNEGAMKDYREAIKLAPNDAAAYNNLAMALLERGRLNEALTNVNEAIDKDNNNHHCHDTKGQICMAMGEYESALREFNYALDINASSDALENRAKCYRKLAEKEEDPTKKDELFSKAESDEKKAKSLKKDN